MVSRTRSSIIKKIEPKIESPEKQGKYNLRLRNYSKEERELLHEIVLRYKMIAFKFKGLENISARIWIQIAKEFNQLNKITNRSVQSLKSCWGNRKQKKASDIKPCTENINIQKCIITPHVVSSKIVDPLEVNIITNNLPQTQPHQIFLSENTEIYYGTEYPLSIGHLGKNLNLLPILCSVSVRKTDPLRTALTPINHHQTANVGLGKFNIEEQVPIFNNENSDLGSVNVGHGCNFKKNNEPFQLYESPLMESGLPPVEMSVELECKEPVVYATKNVTLQQRGYRKEPVPLYRCRTNKYQETIQKNPPMSFVVLPKNLEDTVAIRRLKLFKKAEKDLKHLKMQLFNCSRLRSLQTKNLNV